MLLEQGVPAPLVGELAGEDVEYVCVRLAGVRREVAEAELTAWVAARSPRAAADELARLLRRTDEPAHRALALYALRRNGERRDSARASGTGGGRSSRAGGLGPARSRSGHGTRRAGEAWVSVAARPGHERRGNAPSMVTAAVGRVPAASSLLTMPPLPHGRAGGRRRQPLSAAATTSRASSWIRARCSGPLKLSA